jgi:hypothetical protein
VAIQSPSRALSTSTRWSLIIAANISQGLVLILWSSHNLSLTGLAADLPVFRLVCCLGLVVPGSDVPSPHRVCGVTAAQVPSEAAKKHVGAPLSPENVTIVKFRQNFQAHLSTVPVTAVTARFLAVTARF